MAWEYALAKRLVEREPLPAMLVDLDLLDANIDRIAGVVRGAGKKLRLATKSVRVPRLIAHILERGKPAFQGLMAYSPHEALFLARQGFDDILVAYPAVRAEDLVPVAEAAGLGKRVVLMVDEPAHLDAIEGAFKGGARWPVCIDADVSYRPFGGALHLGVQRSPIRSIDAFAALVDRIGRSKAAYLSGVMGYEAQIAGLGDTSPFHRFLNPILRLLKRLSGADVRRRREVIHHWLENHSLKLELFNGGGTGSVRTTSTEPWITEVTAGSGFLQSHLFDYYASNVNVPAFAFALGVTRVPQPGVVTCEGGGFIASGSAGREKTPVPFLPAGLSTLPDEGWGEVQTPFRLPPGVALAPGDPVFARPAKAGEIAEHFREYLLVRGGKVIERAPTYRGLGLAFY